jgi:hypothetical protein
MNSINLTDRSMGILEVISEHNTSISHELIIERALYFYSRSRIKPPDWVDKRTLPREKKYNPRTYEFFQLYEKGMNQIEIANKYGISRERVRQIIAKHPDYKRHKAAKLSPDQKMFIRRNMVFDNFWKGIDNSGGNDACWPWTRSISGHGYGRFHCKEIPDAKGYAHRAAYIMANGAIPDEMDILHKCNNPICCNPSHLYAGTPKQNMEDRERRYYNGELTRGKRKTSPKKDLILKLLNEGKSPSEVIELTSCASSYVYRLSSKPATAPDAHLDDVGE